MSPRRCRASRTARCCRASRRTEPYAPRSASCGGSLRDERGPGRRPGPRRGMSSAPAGALQVVQVRAQLVRPARVLELADRLRLDLADALARDVELLADFLER